MSERVEDLQYRGLSIIQGEGFRFGTDSVLLAGYVRARATDRVIDLGTGTGVLAILINGRTGADVTAIELQPQQADMARRSAEMNGQTRINVRVMDIRTAHEQLGHGAYDIAVCNPPYHSSEDGQASQNPTATHELTLTVRELAASAAKLLKFGGRLYTMCPAHRLAEYVAALCAERLEPKRLRLVCSVEGKAPYLALIEAKKGAAHGLDVEIPLIITNADGAYTAEANAIYHRTDKDGV